MVAHVSLRRLKAKHRRRLDTVALPGAGADGRAAGSRPALSTAGMYAGAILTVMLVAVAGPPLVSGARMGLVPGFPLVTVTPDITKRMLSEAIPALSLSLAEGGPEDAPGIQVSGLPRAGGIVGQTVAFLTGVSDYDARSLLDAGLPQLPLVTSRSAAPHPQSTEAQAEPVGRVAPGETGAADVTGPPPAGGATGADVHAPPGATAGESAPPGREAQAQPSLAVTEVLRPGTPQPGTAKPGQAGAARAGKVGSWGESPLVAIFHSHSSEAYRGTSGVDYLWGEQGGVISVGDELARTLVGEFGIPVVHSRKIHDLPKWREAYMRSQPTVQEILSSFPSIEVVLDIHRDAAPGPLEAGGTLEVSGKKSAKILVVVSNDKFGLPHPRWTENLAFARQLDAKMSEMYPGLSRGVAVRSTGRFNQHLHHRAVILEIGATVNTVGEAKTAARLLANVLASLLRDIEGG